MNHLRMFFWIILLAILQACTSQSDTDSNYVADTTSQKKTEPKDPAKIMAVGIDSLFQIELPSNMQPQSDLNQDASLQYAFTKRVSGSVKEHYVIIITDTKAEIESYDLSVEFDAMSFSQAALESVVAGYDTYEILTTDPVVEQINGMDCVIYEIDAALGDVETYHMLGVFEGQHAFYQVLTWTLLDQKNEFKDAMTAMLQSFDEI